MELPIDLCSPTIPLLKVHLRFLIFRGAQRENMDPSGIGRWLSFSGMSFWKAPSWGLVLISARWSR